MAQSCHVLYIGWHYWNPRLFKFLFNSLRKCPSHAWLITGHITDNNADISGWPVWLQVKVRPAKLKGFDGYRKRLCTEAALSRAVLFFFPHIVNCGLFEIFTKKKDDWLCSRSQQWEADLLLYPIMHFPEISYCHFRINIPRCAGSGRFETLHSKIQHQEKSTFSGQQSFIRPTTKNLIVRNEANSSMNFRHMNLECRLKMSAKQIPRNWCALTSQPLLPLLLTNGRSVYRW